MHKLTPPKLVEVKTFLASLIRYGDQESFAALLDITPSAISRQLNPYDELRPWPYLALRFQYAGYMISEELGDAILALFNSHAQAWKQQTAEEAVKEQRATSSELLGTIQKLSDELSNVVIAEIEQKPMSVRFQEAQKALRAFDTGKEKLQSYINGLMLDNLDDSAMTRQEEPLEFRARRDAVPTL